MNIELSDAEVAHIRKALDVFESEAGLTDDEQHVQFAIIGKLEPDVERWDKGQSWIDLDSTNLKRMRYTAEDMTLEIEFKNGARWLYEQVPFNVSADLLQAESQGRFFNDYIKGKFEVAKQERNSMDSENAT